MRLGCKKRFSKYDEYWIINNIFKGYTPKEICLSVDLKEDSAANIYTLLRKNNIKKIKVKKYRSRKYTQNIDSYWIVKQILVGYSMWNITYSTGIHFTTIRKVLERNNLYTCYDNMRVNYGITEIAKELGISRQRVHQKVKACLSPYIKYKRGKNLDSNKNKGNK
jgi:hypothetical protein